MSTKRDSVKNQNKDLKMVSFATIADQIRAGKLLGEDLLPDGIISIKSLALLEREGVKIKRVDIPVTKSDLSPEQIKDIKSRKARLMKIEIPGLYKLYFFSYPKTKWQRET